MFISSYAIDPQATSTASPVRFRYWHRMLLRLVEGYGRGTMGRREYESKMECMAYQAEMGWA